MTSVLPSIPAKKVHLGWPLCALPSLSDCLFIAVMSWLFISGSGWAVLLSDGDTGWHIRTGEFILDTHSVPTHDLFSFSRAGAEWFSWEWLSDVGFALAHRLGGLKGVVLLSGIVISLCATLLFRYMIWRGANIFAALFATLLALSASSVHYLARPHLFTLLLVTISAWIIARDRHCETPWIWVLAPLSSLWANLHGGFLAVFVFLGCLILDAALRSLLEKRSGLCRRRLARYIKLALICLASTLLNPYGWRLHSHIARYLNSDWILQAVDEFQSPNFRSESMFQFELLLFAALSLLSILIAKKHFYEAFVILFWAQAALRSVRHVPIFALVAAPVLASELTLMWTKWTALKPNRSVLGLLRDLLNEFPAHCKRTSIWPVALCGLLAVGPFIPSWPRDFPENKFPIATVNRNLALISGNEGRPSRVLTSDQWGDYLIYRLYPHHRVFVDGRSDFYGASVGRDYLDLMNAQSGWQGLLKRYDFTVALVPSNWPLSELLKLDPGWRARYHDSQATLFEREDSRMAN